jgi:omega-amidase
MLNGVQHMIVACCQLNIVWEDKKANHERTRKLVAEAKLPKGSLLVLPEMFSTGFSFNIAAMAEGSARESEKFVGELAREFGIYVLGGVINHGKDPKDAKGRNELVVASPDGSELSRYCKMHPFTLSGEKANFGPGESPVLFKWHDFTVAPFICYDLRFPEIFRMATRKGAQLIVVIANWPVVRIEHWITLLKARAIENQAYVAGVNRCGTDPTYIYNGRSIIVDPHGEIIADAGDSESIIRADISAKTVVDWRHDFPALKDVRPELIPER